MRKRIACLTALAHRVGCYPARIFRRIRILPLATSLLFGVLVASFCKPAVARQEPSKSCDPRRSTLEVADFGARGDHVTDNIEPLTQAIAYAVKCSAAVIHIPTGTYIFRPTGPTRGILLASNISIVGDGIGRTILMVASDGPTANFASFLWARNQDHIEIRGITFVGNNVAIFDRAGRPLNSYGSAITIAMDTKIESSSTGTPRNLSHFVLSNTSFENFNGAAWISIVNYNAAYTIDDIEIRDSQFVSHEKNAINPSNIGYPANAISVMGSLTSASGLVFHVRISGNTIDAAHIKGGVAIWSSVRGVLITENIILDAGSDNSIPNDRGAYAISVYNNAYYHDSTHTYGESMGGLPPDDVHIERNLVRNPKSCGIYAAGANRLWIQNNDISGQIDPENQTLPKGAIALNQPIDATVMDNKITSSHIGMSLYAGKLGHIVTSNNSISDIPAGGMAFDRLRTLPRQAH